MDNNEKSLKKRMSSLLEKPKRPFTEGDLVTWKPLLRNKDCPQYNEKVIVVEVLSKPILDGTAESISSFYREPLDLILGMLDSDGDFITFHYDSRRFQHAE
jgi:hypothetical protein